MGFTHNFYGLVWYGEWSNRYVGFVDQPVTPETHHLIPTTGTDSLQVIQRWIPTVSYYHFWIKSSLFGAAQYILKMIILSLTISGGFQIQKSIGAYWSLAICYRALTTPIPLVMSCLAPECAQLVSSVLPLMLLSMATSSNTKIPYIPLFGSLSQIFESDSLIA